MEKEEITTYCDYPSCTNEPVGTTAYYREPEHGLCEEHQKLRRFILEVTE